MTEAWSVHILGPDDILEATDRLDAMKQAQALNAEMIGHLEWRADHGEPATEFAPIVWAVPRQEVGHEPGCRLHPQYPGYWYCTAPGHAQGLLGRESTEESQVSSTQVEE